MVWGDGEEAGEIEKKKRLEREGEKVENSGANDS